MYSMKTSEQVLMAGSSQGHKRGELDASDSSVDSGPFSQVINMFKKTQFKPT